MSQSDDIAALVKARLQQAQNALEASNECYVQAENFVRQVREYLQTL
ncbi:hypothetical protein IQ265_28020 [Nodosilinea sp. LEGE 06152]|nr:hypothetical protein [Nodosilinea sp. LEGE 06152]MBE9158208.1 hypothetical protein [Nodosilinea sp. LEGE 06152]MBE9160639.1 hypothetical protein [Nodosilinea sp. LEGE 06152]